MYDVNISSNVLSCRFHCWSSDTLSVSDVGLVSVKCSGCSQCMPHPVYCRRVVNVLTYTLLCCLLRTYARFVPGLMSFNAVLFYLME